MPVIAVAGLMVITHGYKPSIKQDVLFFLLATVATFVLMDADFIQSIKPYFFVIGWTVLSIFLLYFIKRLWSVGAIFNVLMVFLALISSELIACIYDFYKIPGEDTNVVLNFYVLALNTWAFFMPAIYYAYCALERKENEGVLLSRPVAYRN